MYPGCVHPRLRGWVQSVETAADRRTLEFLEAVRVELSLVCERPELLQLLRSNVAERRDGGFDRFAEVISARLAQDVNPHR